MYSTCAQMHASVEELVLDFTSLSHVPIAATSATNTCNAPRQSYQLAPFPHKNIHDCTKSRNHENDIPLISSDPPSPFPYKHPQTQDANQQQRRGLYILPRGSKPSQRIRRTIRHRQLQASTSLHRIVRRKEICRCGGNLEGVQFRRIPVCQD
jgi:hypothetical protein